MTRRLAGVLLVLSLAACGKTDSTPPPTTPPPPPPPPPPASSAWRTTGALGLARSFAVTVPLQSGKVLIAGGQLDTMSATLATASAELYDPAAGTWSPVAPMGSERGSPCAVRLTSGKVLVAGGWNLVGDMSLATAEVYDPVGNSWAATSSPMSITRGDGATCTLLSNGKVLVAGGWTGKTANVTIATADLYDPATDSFSPTGSMAARRNSHTATLLASGEVLVTGGFDGTAISSAERYSPATGLWTPAGNLPAATGVQTATLLASGKVLVAGGCFDYAHRGNAASDRGAFLYDPAAGTWMTTASLPWGLNSAVALPLASGDVLLVGGTYDSGGGLKTTRYQVATSTWVDGLPTPSNHGSGLGAAPLPGGSWLVIGGVVPGLSHQLSVATTEIFSE
jgi:hypothetical protein